MNYKPYLLGIAAACVLVFGIVVGAQAVSKASRDDARNRTTTEKVVVDYNSDTVVEKNATALRLFDDEQVKNQSGTTLQEGDDYDFYPSTGTIQWYDTPDTISGNNATITYTYLGWSTPVAQMRGPFADYYGILPYLVLVLVGVTVLVPLLIAVGRVAAGASIGSAGRRR